MVSRLLLRIATMEIRMTLMDALIYAQFKPIQTVLLLALRVTAMFVETQLEAFLNYVTMETNKDVHLIVCQSK